MLLTLPKEIQRVIFDMLNLETVSLLRLACKTCAQDLRKRHLLSELKHRTRAIARSLRNHTYYSTYELDYDVNNLWGTWTIIRGGTRPIRERLFTDYISIEKNYWYIILVVARDKFINRRKLI